MPDQCYHENMIIKPTSSAATFDEGADMHASELYSPDQLAAGVDTLDQVGPEQIAFYRENGYLVVRQAFNPVEIKAAIDGLLHLIMGGCPDFKGIWFEAKAASMLDQLAPDQRQDAVRKIAFFVDHEPRLRAISHHARLFQVLTVLLGERTPEMFQDMALIKPPRLGREKPWHQDHAYFDYTLQTPIVGTWIALDEATVENGCMQLLPGRHKEGPIVHFKRRDWQICDNQVMGQRSVAAPLKPGGMLFFDALLPHGTPHNASANRRRALQFHYAPAGVTKTTTAERLAIFGSEGKDVSC
jgi:phytanoyl-CoA hydroxylase